MSENKSQNKPKDKKPKNKKSKVKTFFKILFLTMLLLMVTGVTLLGGYVFSIVKNTPPLDVNAILRLNETSVMVDQKDQFITNIILSEEQRFIVESEDIPQNLKDAYVSIEDERFYTHKGVDVRRLIGSQLINIKRALSGTLGNPQGGSTLTQQLIKNTVLTNEVSIVRKIKEMYLAINLEQILSKDEILTAYINTIPMGGHQYGLEAASIRFFGKSVKDLSLQQCAYLAGITQAPSSYDALSDRNKEDPSRYINRTKTVLNKMHELGYITDEEYNNTIDVTPESLEFNPRKETQSMQYEWFTRPVITQVKKDLQEKLKYTEEEATKLLVNGGLKIYITMDKELQNSVQSILNDPNNFTYAFAGGKDTLKDGVPLLQAAATIVDYKTGQVKAMVGGRGDQPPASTNRAYSSLKSIGSATKPLTVYAPAIDMKIMGTGTVIDDTPIIKGNKYLPKNENRSYKGYLTLRDALRTSNNVVATKTVYEVGEKNAIAYGKKFGLVYSKDSETISAAALGQFHNSQKNPDGSNTFTMAAAFGTFGNNGILTEPILYTKILDASGNVLLENKPKQTNIISPQTSYIMYNLLKEPVENYSASAAKFGSIPVAGKTGTTTANKDYWFAGLTPYYSAAVWIGYDIPTTMPNTSGKNAPPLWGKIMAKAHAGLDYKEIKSPGGISTVAVCADSGHLPTELCRLDPRGNRVRSELYINGTAPSQLCTTHVKVKVNKENNKLATENTPPDLVADKVFITRPSSYTNTSDYQYVVPTEEDDTIYVPPVEEKPEEENKPDNGGNTTTPPDNNNNNNNNNNGNSGNEGNEGGTE